MRGPFYKVPAWVYGDSVDTHFVSFLMREQCRGDAMPLFLDYFSAPLHFGYLSIEKTALGG